MSDRHPVRALRTDFEPRATQVAAHVLGGQPSVFSPGARVSRYAYWFVPPDDERLVAVVMPGEKATVGDEVLAFGLAWQGDRDLNLVLPADLVDATLARLPWIATEVRVWSLPDVGGPRLVPGLARAEVFEQLRGLRARRSKTHALLAPHEDWVVGIHTDDLVKHTRSYLSWHHHGLQVLKMRSTRNGLRIQAGVQYVKPEPGREPYDRTFNVAPTDADIDDINARVQKAMQEGKSRSSNMLEHRLQATLVNQPEDLGLAELLREYPAYRGFETSEKRGRKGRRGRPGYIDFLGLDSAGNLHVVETKVGHDPRVVLQALDYAIWVRANEQTLRAELRAQGRDVPEVRAGSRDDSPVPMNLVLGASKKVAFNPYLASQIEALTGDCKVRVHLIADAKATPLVLEKLEAADYWDQDRQLVSQQVQPPRRAGRLTRDLRSGR